MPEKGPCSMEEHLLCLLSTGDGQLPLVWLYLLLPQPGPHQHYMTVSLG